MFQVEDEPVFCRIRANKLYLLRKRPSRAILVLQCFAYAQIEWEINAMKPMLTIDRLIGAAKCFCEAESRENHADLIGVTDGKAVGTYVEHRFQRYLQSQYEVEGGSSAKGIDLPGSAIQTDIKVTSITQPQSSCPFKNARQKIFGLG